MIHHFARALAVREQARLQSAASSRPSTGGGAMHAATSGGSRAWSLRIRHDPADLRRTVITGRFADVCAALDRLAAAELDTAS